MRYLAIDFGSKNVGIAISDETGRVALPYQVLPNNKNLLTKVLELILEKKVTDVVIGDSKNYKGKDNKIMEKTKVFAEEIQKNSAPAVHFEPEFLTSAAAKQVQGESKMLDASAAALILQSFLDKQK